MLAQYRFLCLHRITFCGQRVSDFALYGVRSCVSPEHSEHFILKNISTQTAVGRVKPSLQHSCILGQKNEYFKPSIHTADATQLLSRVGVARCVLIRG